MTPEQTLLIAARETAALKQLANAREAASAALSMTKELRFVFPGIEESDNFRGVEHQLRKVLGCQHDNNEDCIICEGCSRCDESINPEGTPELCDSCREFRKQARAEVLGECPECQLVEGCHTSSCSLDPDKGIEDPDLDAAKAAAEDGPGQLYDVVVYGREAMDIDHLAGSGMTYDRALKREMTACDRINMQLANVAIVPAGKYAKGDTLREQDRR